MAATGAGAHRQGAGDPGDHLRKSRKQSPPQERAAGDQSGLRWRPQDPGILQADGEEEERRGAWAQTVGTIGAGGGRGEGLDAALLDTTQETYETDGGWPLTTGTWPVPNLGRLQYQPVSDHRVQGQHVATPRTSGVLVHEYRSANGKRPHKPGCVCVRVSKCGFCVILS